jgi:hypothetical protein
LSPPVASTQTTSHPTEQPQSSSPTTAGGAANFKQPSLEILDKLLKQVKEMKEFISTLHPKSSIETLAEAVKIMKMVLFDEVHHRKCIFLS